MAVAVFDIWIFVKETATKIHASEDKWCRKKQIAPDEWLYCFEDLKGQLRPDYDYNEPILRIKRVYDELHVTIEEYHGYFHADIYAYGVLLWSNVGGRERRHVGDSTTVKIPVPPPVAVPPIAVPPPVWTREDIERLLKATEATAEEHKPIEPEEYEYVGDEKSTSSTDYVDLVKYTVPKDRVAYLRHASFAWVVNAAWCQLRFVIADVEKFTDKSVTTDGTVWTFPQKKKIRIPEGKDLLVQFRTTDATVTVKAQALFEVEVRRVR